MSAPVSARRDLGRRSCVLLAAQRQRDGVARDPLLELGRRSFGDDRAVVDDQDAVGERVGLIHVVRGEEHRRSQLVAELADMGPEVGPALRIEPGRGLVEEHQPRLVDQPHDDVEPPPLPARERPAGAVPDVVEIERREQRPRRAPSPLRRSMP